MASKTLFSKLIPCFSIPRSHSIIRCIRPLASTTVDLFCRKIPNHQFAVRSFSSRPTTSSLNDPSPNWSNRPPKETILLDGCDFEHWLCVVETPDPNWTRDQLIDHYIKILAKVVGSEEEARMKIYSVSTKCYFAFGANVSEEVSYKLKELPELRWVLPDSYLDVKNKDYGGEPFINGEAVPYDPKYHEEWIRNNSRANERSRRNDRPRNFDRSRNFERRGEMRSGGGPAPSMNQGYQGNPNPTASPPPTQNTTQSPSPPMQNNNFNRPLPSQGSPTSNVGYQNQIPNPGYQGGGGGYQGGNPGYQPSPNPNMPLSPQYATQSQQPQNLNFNRPPPAQNYYQGGGAPGYQQGVATGYQQGGAPGYQQGGATGYQQGGAPAYQQGGAPGYQSNVGGYSNYQGNPNSNPTQSGGGAYPGSSVGGYQGGNVPSQGPDVPVGGDKAY